MKKTLLKVATRIAAFVSFAAIFFTACKAPETNFGAFVDAQLRSDAANIEKRSRADITAFYFVQSGTSTHLADGEIDALGSPPVINVVLPLGSAINSLTPTVSINGASYSPTGAQDFSTSKTNPVRYTVYSENGQNQKIYHVTVLTTPLTGISIRRAAAKSIYEAGEAFDSTGLEIDGAYGPTTTAIPSSGWTLDFPAGLDRKALSPGTHTVTVKSTENAAKTTTFTISVQDYPLTGVEIEALPARLKYLKEEAFEPAGLAVRGILSNGAKIPVASGSFNIVGWDVLAASAGVKNLVVSVNGVQSAGGLGYNAIKILELASLAITTPPVDTSYKLGKAETLKIDGMVVSAVFSGGGESETREIRHADGSASYLGGALNHSFPASNPSFSKPGDESIFFTYTHSGISKSAEQIIHVLNNEAAITSFSLPNESVSGTIDPAARMIAVGVAPGVSVDANNPVPAFSLSPGAAAAGSAWSGSGDLWSRVYTVTSEDGDVSTSWTVNLTRSSASANDITAFSFPATAGASVTINGAEIDCEVPVGSLTAMLSPGITISGVSISPSSGTALDFSKGPVSYTVTAQNGNQKVYAVNAHYPAMTGAGTDGTIYTVIDGSYVYETHVFKETGHLRFATNPNITNAEVLIVGGGAGGGFSYDSTHPGGGGGSGGFVASSGVTISGTDLAVTVGTGGQGAPSKTTNHAPGAPGQSSSFGPLVAYGGGGGATYEGFYPLNGISGGSGGGGAGLSSKGGNGITGQGNKGGAADVLKAGGGGGGGGDGVAGGTGASNGSGGAGLSSGISGTVQWYAGGGASGLAGARGGAGGGGSASAVGLPGGYGAPNLGGGGAGGLGNIAGGNGGDGIVIIRFYYVAP
jgi:hypothetical protein